MSELSKYVFDPIKAALAVGAKSANAAVSSAASAALASYNQVSADVVALGGALAGNGTSASQSDANLIGDLEKGLNTVADTFITASLVSLGPVGAVLAPETVSATNALLTFGEAHAVAYVSQLFAVAQATVNAAQAASVKATQAAAAKATAQSSGSAFQGGAAVTSVPVTPESSNP